MRDCNTVVFFTIFNERSQLTDNISVKNIAHKNSDNKLQEACETSKSVEYCVVDLNNILYFIIFA